MKPFLLYSKAPHCPQSKVQIPLASTSFLTTLDHSPFLDFLPYLP